MEYRFGAAAALLWVACLPLIGAGYGIAFAGRILSERLRKERQRKRCAKIREARAKFRLSLQEARKTARHTTARTRNLKTEISGTRRGVTGEEAEGLWERAHGSVRGMVQFGMLLLEVEDAVDSSCIMGTDAFGNPFFAGRRPGIKGWLEEHCPHIGYKTAMRYKALAKKMLEKAP